MSKVFSISSSIEGTRVWFKSGSSPKKFYVFDGDKLRVWSKSGSSPKRFYVFDGDKLIGEVSGSTPAPTDAYTWGADGLVSERILGSSPESLYYQFGPQGETRFLTNSSGAVANSYYYNAYGRVLTGTGTKYNRYLYGGKFGYYSDGGMGLMLAGQRWYSSFVMKWLSRDPIKYEGGDNLYAYVGENPIKWRDANGLIPFYNYTPIGTPPQRIKPEIGPAHPPTYCYPQSTCNVDGWYPPSAMSCRPEVYKIPDSCTATLELKKDGTLSVHSNCVMPKGANIFIPNSLNPYIPHWLHYPPDDSWNL